MVGNAGYLVGMAKRKVLQVTNTSTNAAVPIHDGRDKILCKWVIAQREAVISYRRFGTTYRSHLSGVKYPKPRRAQFVSNSRRKPKITQSIDMAVHKMCQVQQRCGEE
jgi:hypothetical protein